MTLRSVTAIGLSLLILAGAALSIPNVERASAESPRPLLPCEDRRGWEAVQHPVNLALQCLPTNLTADGGNAEPAALGAYRVDDDGNVVFFCPEGWEVAVHPLNPLLRCVPTQLAPGS